MPWLVVTSICVPFARESANSAVFCFGSDHGIIDYHANRVGRPHAGSKHQADECQSIQ
jgi:hypothetical protein